MEEMTKEPKIADCYMESVAVMADGIRELMRCINNGWDSAMNAPLVECPKIKPLRNSPNVQLSDKVKKKRNDCKKAIERIEAIFFASSEEFLKEMKNTAAPMQALLELTLDYDARYCEHKRRINALDYSDLEHLAAKFLESHDISDRYTEIMVDEFQDVSYVQNAIFNRVSDNGRKLFVVGDIKQSIYRFRLAEPEIFKEKLHDENTIQIRLLENFRSRREIIDAVNSVFEKIMTDSLGDTDYKDNKLVFGASYYEGEVEKPEITLIRSVEGENKAKTEARYVANKISQLVNAGEKFSDIAILMRSPGKYGDVFRQELAQSNIPVSFGACGGYFETTEISALLAILRIMDNPHNDIYLLSAMTSPFYGFTPDEMSEIRNCDKKSDLYGALVKSAADNEKSRGFLENLKRMRKLAPDMTEENIIRMILNDTDAEAICSLMSDGDGRMANLMQLISIASRFENDGYHGLHRFLMYIDRLREKGTDIDTGHDISNCVKIMSVHASKGLQFKTVFLCDAAHRFNMTDANESVLIHPQLGLGPKCVDVKRQLYYPTVARNAISMRLKKETRSEEMRLMYVALTRAEERLFITACLDKPEDKAEKAKTAVLEDTSDALTWLLYADTLEVKIEEGQDIEEPAIIISGLECSGSTDNELKDDLQFEYAHADAVTIPSLVIATELKKYNEDADEEGFTLIKSAKVKKPSLKDEKGLSAAEIGTATHILLQHMDFEKNVDDELFRIFKEGFLSEKQRDAADKEAVKNFIESPAGRKIREAEKVHREFAFTVLCDAGKLLGKAEGEEVLLRGVVDCAIEYDDGIVVVDYKTDRVKTKDDVNEKASHYTPQMKAYKIALEQVFEKPVKETILCFLSNNMQVSI